METISFSCPKCNFQMSAETIYCGQIVRCAQCSSEVQIPQKAETPTPPTSGEVTVQVDKKSNIEKPFSMLPVLLWILVGLQLGCFVLLLCISLNTKSSPRAYEYQVQNFDRDERRSFNSRIADLADDGWEYVGVLTNNGMNTKEVLFRRIKTSTSEKSKAK